MGRKGLFSSAAAGVSLVAASLVLVIGVSAMIGFRGFKSARQAPTSQSVVLEAPAAEREAGAAATTPVVIGGERQATRTRSKARRTARSGSSSSAPAARTQVQKAPARSGLSSSAKAKPKAPASAPEADPAPVPPASTGKRPAATPVDEVVDQVDDVVQEVQKPVESVGDVLLDLRDALP